MPIIEQDDTIINYQLSRRTNINFTKIYVDDLNGVHVTAAANKDQVKVEAFLRKKASWIQEKWRETHPDLYEIDTITEDENRKIAYLGRHYQLVKKENALELSFQFQKGKFLFLYPKTMSRDERTYELKRLLHKWLFEKAEEKLPAEVEQDQTRLGKKEEDSIHLNWRVVQRNKSSIASIIEDLKKEKVC
ncbi:DUF45 domain-containing protein [Halobacillus salinarum]|uniref:DUF45 domain-containing protein n=1 Tax=Halobacillus salinarum TaxID=2932257 RepID=A0ABY4EH08_9BACI|nr:YgjP-like metallopeptidase domain-containing protein [Halobacillus salinarum]UOQ43280.1 DUF45 domain-containing protein [Halobacillus salinarum]